MGRVREGVPLPSRLGGRNVTSSPGLLVNQLYRTCTVVGYETVTRVLIGLHHCFLQFTTAESRGGQELNGSQLQSWGTDPMVVALMSIISIFFGVTVMGTT